MINAAIKIFALNGYERAGTDSMIKEAGISKGLLFHYFGSKLNLYRFVTEYCVRYLIVELSGGIDEKEKNLFDRIRLVEQAKLGMLRNYPYLDLFITTMRGESDPEAAQSAAEWVEKADNLYSEIIEGGSDPALLRSGVGMDNAIQIARLCMDGYKLRCAGQGATPREVVEGFIPYLNVLKKSMC